MASNYRPPHPTWSQNQQSTAASYRAAASRDRDIAYRTLSLEKVEIRLLVITPDENPRSPIYCRLQQIPLADAEDDYVALSYCWGKANKTVHINISGKLNQVSTSLGHALQELRRRRLYRVWVDQLCIDQSNHEELAHQVERMGDIYRSAFRTMAWLGYCLENDRAEFEKARSLVQSLESWREGKRETPQPKGKNSTKKSTATPLPLSSQSDRLALWSVLSREYWTRAWIIQEVIVSQSVHFFWNGESFSL